MSGEVFARSTEKRAKELVASIRDLLERGRYKKGELLTLRGRLQFCEGQLFGRSSAHQLQLVSDHATCERGGVVGPELREALSNLAERLERNTPRRVLCRPRGLAHLYTDACHDSDKSGLGGELVNESGEVISAFSLKLTEIELSRINIDNSKTVILQIEALAVLVGLKFLCRNFSDDEIISFGDNDGALGSYISLRSENKFVKNCLKVFSLWEEESFPLVWFERVASHSNIADGPSRLDLTLLEHHAGCKLVDVRAHDLLEEILSHSLAG